MSEITAIGNKQIVTEQTKAKQKAETKPNEFNSAFTEKDNVKIEITSRGEGEPAGLSYDFYYGNENTKGLKDYYESGLFEDVTKDKKGNDKFTNQDKLNLVSKFKEVHTQKGLKSDFAKMYVGETFEYTKDEYVALAEAAGYKLKGAQAEPKKVITEENIELTASRKPRESVHEPSVMPDTLKPEKPLSKPFASKNKVVIPKDYTTSSDEQIQEYLKTHPDLADKNSQERSDFLNDEIADLTQEKYKLSEQYKTVKGKKFLFWGGKEKKVNWTPEEKTANEARLKEVEAQLDKAKFYKAYVDKVENTNYWGGNMSIKTTCDDSGKVIEVHPEYTKVVVTDETGKEIKAARLDVYDCTLKADRTIYHPITIKKVVNEQSGSAKPYYDVVADVSIELTNIKEK